MLRKRQKVNTTRTALIEVGKVIIALLLGLAVCAMLGGCSPRIVTQEVPVLVEHTTEHRSTDIVRDTLIMRDSVWHYVQGDTVRIERWHHVANVSKMIHTDTIRDTVPRVVTVTRTEVHEVNRLRWWQKALMVVGCLPMLCAGIGLIIKIRKFV